jgi:glycosyltransferase involved in cell wall biosynthesis
VGFRQELEKLASQLNVSPSVVFTGHLPNPLDELADADVVLMCSRCEGFGRVTVEAMLLRRPIVAADTCGTVELIENESTGLLYNWGDPLNLADKIQQIVTNPTLGAQLGNAARGSALSRFTVEQYVNSMIGVYENILCRN